jgi:hypothetical protein
VKPDPDLRVQVSPLPRPGDLQQSARADRIGLFSGLLSGKEGAAERRLGMDRASVIFQKSACAIQPSRRHDCRNIYDFPVHHDNRAWTGKEIVECESQDVGFIQIFRDAPQVAGNEVAWDRATVLDASLASARNPLESEFGSFS